MKMAGAVPQAFDGTGKEALAEAGETKIR